MRQQTVSEVGLATFAAVQASLFEVHEGVPAKDVVLNIPTQ